MGYEPTPVVTWNRSTPADGLLFNDEYNALYQDIDTYIAGNAGSAPPATMKQLYDSDALKIPTSYLDTDGTLAANSDSKIATQKAVKTYADTKIPLTYIDTDRTLAAKSDTKLPSQKAVYNFVFPPWVTSTLYAAGSYIFYGNSLWVCVTQHTSNDFVTDWLTNGYWVCMGDSPGTIKQSAGITLEPGYQFCDGTSMSKTTYALLWARLNKTINTATMSLAAPCIVTCNGHGFAGGERVYFTTNGSLPASVPANTTFFVIYINANTFWLASSWANYVANTKVNTNGQSQSGAHTLIWAPFGIVDVNSFYLPDTRGIFVRSNGISSIMTNANSVAFASYLGVMQNDKMHAHWHDLWINGNDSVRGAGSDSLFSITQIEPLAPIRNAVSDGVHGTPRTGSETNPANIGLNFIIKV